MENFYVNLGSRQEKKERKKEEDGNQKLTHNSTAICVMGFSSLQTICCQSVPKLQLSFSDWIVDNLRCRFLGRNPCVELSYMCMMEMLVDFNHDIVVPLWSHIRVITSAHEYWLANMVTNPQVKRPVFLDPSLPGSWWMVNCRCWFNSRWGTAWVMCFSEYRRWHPYCWAMGSLVQTGFCKRTSLVSLDLGVFFFSLSFVPHLHQKKNPFFLDMPTYLHLLLEFHDSIMFWMSLHAIEYPAIIKIIHSPK